MLAVEQLEEGVHRDARGIGDLRRAELVVVLDDRQAQSVIEQALALAAAVLASTARAGARRLASLRERSARTFGETLGESSGGRGLEQQRPAKHLLGDGGSRFSRALAQALRQRSVQPAGDAADHRHGQRARRGGLLEAAGQHLLERRRRPT